MSDSVSLEITVEYARTIEEVFDGVPRLVEQLKAGNFDEALLTCRAGISQVLEASGEAAKNGGIRHCSGYRRLLYLEQMIMGLLGMTPPSLPLSADVSSN